jgi:hypothetical protein
MISVRLEVSKNNFSFFYILCAERWLEIFLCFILFVEVLEGADNNIKKNIDF